MHRFHDVGYFPFHHMLRGCTSVVTIPSFVEYPHARLFADSVDFRDLAAAFNGQERRRSCFSPIAVISVSISRYKMRAYLVQKRGRAGTDPLGSSQPVLTAQKREIEPCPPAQTRMVVPMECPPPSTKWPNSFRCRPIYRTAGAPQLHRAFVVGTDLRIELEAVRRYVKNRKPVSPFAAQPICLQ